MSELSTLVNDEINKLLTLHELTVNRGPTDTEAKQQKATKAIAYKSTIKDIKEHLHLMENYFLDEFYVQEVREYASELYSQGREEATSHEHHIGQRGRSRAFLDVSKALENAVNKL